MSELCICGAGDYRRLKDGLYCLNRGCGKKMARSVAQQLSAAVAVGVSDAIEQTAERVEQATQCIAELREVNDEAPEQGAVTWMDTAEFCRDSGKSAGWARKHYLSVGGKRPGDGPKRRYLFPSNWREFLNQLNDEQGESKQAKRATPKRRQRPQGKLELLPVKGRRPTRKVA